MNFDAKKPRNKKRSTVNKKKNIEHDEAQMNSRSGCCCINSGSCLARRDNHRVFYQSFTRTLVFFIVTSLLAMTVSHICDKYSSSGSFNTIKSDLKTLRGHLDTLTVEVKNVIELRDELKNRLREISSVMPKMSEAIAKLRNEVSEDLGVQTNEKFKDVIRRELQTYDADKTGRTDYALEAAGGSIVSTRDTETYSTGASVLSLFGMPLCQNRNTPRTVIQTGVLPGECWAFKGNSGSVVIELLGSVHISGVTLEHISPSISPTGETTTAPRDFSLWGLKNKDDTEGFLFGEFTYDNCNSSVQYFKVKNTAKEPYDIVEVKIHSNSGSPDYTCIYRIRVHGTLSRLKK